MKVETFLDYNQILKIVFELTDESVDYDLICDTGDISKLTHLKQDY